MPLPLSHHTAFFSTGTSTIANDILCVQLLGIIGVNISPFIDLKLGISSSSSSSTLLDLEDIGNFCILRLVSSLDQADV